MGSLGFSELVLILIIALVVFGPKKLPELSRTLGKALGEFRRATGDLRSAMEEEMRDLERHTKELEQKSQQALGAGEGTPPVYDPDMDTRTIGFAAAAPTNAATATDPGTTDTSAVEVKPPDADNKPA
jgi:TatA/E family protein of Tat protein translocase